MVSPVVLGRGRSQFEGLEGRLKTKLIRAEMLSSGIVILWISADEIENCGGEQTSLEERSRQFCSVNEHKKILL